MSGGQGIVRKRKEEMHLLGSDESESSPKEISLRGRKRPNKGPFIVEEGEREGGKREWGDSVTDSLVESDARNEI